MLSSRKKMLLMDDDEGSASSEGSSSSPPLPSIFLDAHSLKTAPLTARRLTGLLMHPTHPLDASNTPRDAHLSQEEEADIGRASPPLPTLSSHSSLAHSPTPLVSDSNRKDPLPETTPPPIDPFTHLPTLALLVLFSILGCLTRLGLTALFTYPAQAVFPLIWSQAVGSFLMGVCVGWRKDLERWGGKELYFGLGTGLCGSITTFSSWMLQTYEAFSNFPTTAGRTGVHDTADGLTQLLLTLAFACFSFHLGRQLSSTHLPSLPFSRFASSHHHITRFNLPFLLLSFSLYLALLLLCILDPSHTDRTLLLSVLLAPPGTLLRFHLTRLNPILGKPNNRITGRKGIPTLGTFTANILATAVLSTAFVLQRKLGGVSRLQCEVMQAAEDGFCGSLSTVSTFVVELNDLRDRRGVAYLAVSWVVGVGVVVAIVGGVRWNGGGLGEGCSL